MIIWSILFASLAVTPNFATSEKVTRNVVVTAEEEKIRDKNGYQAIAEIHREMDDDHSGSIDRKETTGFMKEDMQMRSSERLRRENAFHGDDDAITVDDLWEAWFESEERSWNNEQLVFWISNVVNLPMYAEKLQRLKIDGTVLPRLAVHNSTFMTQQMGIKSSVHRQKLRLNALDVVLFGHRDHNSKTKDILLAFLALLFTSVLFLYVRQKKAAQLQVNELSTRLTELKSMESEFEDVQKKLNDERSKRSTADGSVSQSEMENLRFQLEEAERRLEMNTAGGGTPLALQPLLRKTCENEMAFMERQRQDCFKEMKEAIEMVDRLQKKQGSVLSSLKLATGAASASDQVDSKIFALKNRMEKIHGLTRETQERWMQIESLCGFPLLYLNETLPLHQSASTSHFYNPNHSGASSMSSSASVTNGNAVRPKISVASSKQNSMNTTSRSLTSSGSNGQIKQHSVDHLKSSHDDEDDSLSKKSSATTATIVFENTGINVNGSEDSQSMKSSVTATSSVAGSTNGTSHEEKKKKPLIARIFKKTGSKSSLINSSQSST